MAWHHIKLPNEWTRPKPECENADVGAWQIGFAVCGRFTIVGIFDHVIETKARIRNFSQPTDDALADVVLALGEGFGSLYDETGRAVEHSVDSVLEHVGRWGRNPDDVADWLLFSRKPHVPPDWRKPLAENESRIGPNAETVVGVAERNSGIVVWALDGHLYSVLPISDLEIRERLMPAAAALKHGIAEHQELIT